MISELKSKTVAREVAEVLRKHGVPGVVLVGDSYVLELDPVLKSVDYTTLAGDDKGTVKDAEKMQRLQSAAKTFGNFLIGARRCEHEMMQLLSPVGRHITTYHPS